MSDMKGFKGEQKVENVNIYFNENKRLPDRSIHKSLPQPIDFPKREFDRSQHLY